MPPIGTTKAVSAGEINFVALPLVALLALVGAPLAFRRAGFLWAKVVFGSLTVMFAALGSAGIIISVQNKTGLSALPLAWLVLPALIFALYRISRIKAE